jgi:hypothetical protein
MHKIKDETLWKCYQRCLVMSELLYYSHDPILDRNLLFLVCSFAIFDGLRGPNRAQKIAPSRPGSTQYSLELTYDVKTLAESNC